MTFILLTAAIIGLVWSLIYIRHFNPITTAVLALTIGGCFGHAFFSVSVITIDRLLIGGMFAQYLLFRYFQRAEHKPIGGMDYVFFGLIFYLFVNVFSSNWRADESAPVSFWLFFYLLPSVIYWVTRNSPVDEREFNIMCYGLGAFGLYLAVTGFAETRQWWWMVYPKHIGDPSVTEFLGRGRGPFQNPISNGIYIGIGWCSALMFWPKVGKRGKAIILALSLVFAVGVYSTYTRSVWMGGATAVGICFWLPSSWSRRGLAIASLIVLGFVGLFAKDALTQFKRDRFVTETQMAESAKLRPMLAAVAVNVFEDKPIFGTGLRQYRGYNHQYVTDGRWNMPLRRVQNYIQHNWILSLLVETGLIGVLLLLAVIVVWLYMAWLLVCDTSLPMHVRQIGLLQLALLSMLLINGMFHDTSSLPGGNTIFFFFGGLTVGQAYKYIFKAKKTDSNLANGPVQETCQYGPEMATLLQPAKTNG